MGTTKAQLIEMALKLSAQGKTFEQIKAELSTSTVSGIDRTKLVTDADKWINDNVDKALLKRIDKFIKREQEQIAECSAIQAALETVLESAFGALKSTYGDITGILEFDYPHIEHLESECTGAQAPEQGAPIVYALALKARARAKRKVVHAPDFKRASGYRVVKNVKAKTESGYENHAEILKALKALKAPFTNSEIGVALEKVLGTKREHFKFGKNGESWSYMVERVYADDSTGAQAPEQGADKGTASKAPKAPRAPKAPKAPEQGASTESTASTGAQAPEQGAALDAIRDAIKNGVTGTGAQAPDKTAEQRAEYNAENAQAELSPIG